MKSTITTLIAAMLVMLTSVTVAQQSQNEIKDEAIKDARKEAKALSKAKWFTQPGTLPLEKQIEKAWMKEHETNEKGFPKYYIGTGNSLGETQATAKQQAHIVAKQSLINKIRSNMASIVQTNINSTPLTAEETSAIQEMMSSSSDLIARKLTKIITITELYRKNKESYECSLRVACSAELAQKAVQEAIKESLSEKTSIKREKLDKLVSF